MRRIYGYGLGAFALAATAVGAQQYQNWVGPNGEQMPGFVLGCPTGVARQVVPCGGVGSPIGVIAQPFVRMGKAAALPVSTTPRTYAITQPVGALTYRGINPCTVDIVVTSVAASLPVVTQPVTIDGETIPNVQLVTSPTGTVNRFEDTLFMARSGRTLSSAPNPMPGTTRYVSIMALSDPGSTPCLYRLGYGMGN
ncbi:hypothetical protein [Methylobacterium frigidaeris]|uniref:Secreted protein n=1 Tax=Methylobacterium frigidaeris TaxID=2038277 RepID=A0AA37HEK5_9HYPH|nr:hypothetical protein [Methylobacterium frigidaeris]GJD63765.1 hypothetical protein MPEAHAMD_3936 [Methylobacterium frigidaeris]